MSVTTTLTPSELVYFNGDKFVKNGMLGDSHTLIHNGSKVSINNLTPIMLLAAFLGNEDKGILRIQMETEKALFGLLTNRFARVILLDVKNEWPDNTLESLIYQKADSLIQKAKNEPSYFVKGNTVPVWLIVREFFSENIFWPHREIISMSLHALNERGIILSKAKNEYIPAPNTAQIVTQQSVEPIQKLISISETGRPDLHKVIVKEIKDTLVSCIKQEQKDLSDALDDAVERLDRD
jgi:hypothetical protein